MFPIIASKTVSQIGILNRLMPTGSAPRSSTTGNMEMMMTTISGDSPTSFNFSAIRSPVLAWAIPRVRKKIAKKTKMRFISGFLSTAGRVLLFYE